MNRFPTKPLLLLLAIALAAGPAAWALEPQAALSRDGAIYQVRTGTIAELLPGQTGGMGDNPALVLEITYPDQAPQRLLVPQTEGAEVESAPFLLVEDASDAVFVVWETRRQYIYSRIYLASYADGRWTEAVELSGDFFSFKSTPRIAVTRDVYEGADAEGNPVERHRTICHVVWWEQAGSGERAIYSPVVLLDGVFQYPNPFFPLPDFDPGEPLTAVEVPPLLERSPTVQAGRDQRSVVIGFTNRASGRFVALEVAVLPQALSYIADEAGLTVVSVGSAGGSLGSIANRAGMHIVDVGQRLRYHSDFVRYLSESAREYVLAVGDPQRVEDLAAWLRAELRDVGARLTVRSHDSDTTASASWLLPIQQPLIAQTGGAADLSPALVNVRLAGQRSAPEIAPDVEPTLFLSQSGAAALVAWQSGDQVLYRETEGDGWGPLHMLQLSPELDLGGAHQLLAQRIGRQ